MAEQSINNRFPSNTLLTIAYFINFSDFQSTDDIKLQSIPAIIGGKDALNELPNSSLLDIINLPNMLSHIVLVLLLADLQSILQLFDSLLQEVDLLLKLMLGKVGVLFYQLVHAGFFLALEFSKFGLGVLEGLHGLSVALVEPIKVAS